MDMICLCRTFFLPCVGQSAFFLGRFSVLRENLEYYKNFFYL